MTTTIVEEFLVVPGLVAVTINGRMLTRSIILSLRRVEAFGGLIGDVRTLGRLPPGKPFRYGSDDTIIIYPEWEALILCDGIVGIAAGVSSAPEWLKGSYQGAHAINGIMPGIYLAPDE